MSKFVKGDMVLVHGFDDEPLLGQVTDPWVEYRGRHPLVCIVLLELGVSVYLEENEVDLALDEYEFMAVSVELEDFEQTPLRGSYYERERWGTLEEAQKDIDDELKSKVSNEWKQDNQLQINRRRKAGPTIGHKAFLWNK